MRPHEDSSIIALGTCLLKRTETHVTGGIVRGALC